MGVVIVALGLHLRKPQRSHEVWARSAWTRQEEPICKTKLKSDRLEAAPRYLKAAGGDDLGVGELAGLRLFRDDLHRHR